MMVAASRVVDVDAEDKVLASLEQALRAAEHQVGIKRNELDVAERVADRIRKQVEDIRGEAGIADDGIEPTGSMTEGIRLYLQARKSEPATAKEVETWLIRKGYRTGAKNFYWSVYGALRAMKEVVGVIKEGETMRFAWRDALPKAPVGWRLVDFPRRTSLASRQRQPEAPVKSRTKGRGH